MTPCNEASAPRRSSDSPTDRLLEGHDFLAARSVKQQLLGELRAGWECGQPARVEDLLGHWPTDPDTDPDAASLLFEEYCQRGRVGDPLTPEEIERRFPSQKSFFTSLSCQQGLLRSLGGEKCGRAALLALPSAGDEVFGFLLGRELGRGSFARVFLAEQTALAGRPVVVKVSAIEGDEPQTLAQLQHTNIMPIYSAHEDPKAGLRVVCMPYFGGASLSRVLQALWAGMECPTQGQQLVKALEIVSGPPVQHASQEICGTDFQSVPVENGQSGGQSKDAGFLELLGGLSYVRASVWIVARLAEALQHAHQRRVLHRDIKPSNVLLGADGQPLLLDFNLSQNLASGQAQAAAALGGTVAYMAPEHLRALASRDPALVRQVDQRADLYELGMVLYEMLTGRRPFDQSASYSPMPALIEAMAVERGRTVPSPRERRLDVSWSLESIARKCLAPNPDERYQQAEHLAEDLRHYLEDRPLKYAPELSRSERVTKFVRRHPRLTQAGAFLTAAAVLLVAGAGIIAATHAQLKAAQIRTYEAEGAEAREYKQEFLKCAERARILINTTTGRPEQVKEGLAVCEQALGSYDILNRRDWQQHPSWQRLEPEDQRALAEDVRELLLLLAAGRVFVATSQPTALKDALAILDRAEAIDGLEVSSALWQDRAVYLEKIGAAADAAAARAKARSLAPTSARDHYLLAAAYDREHRLVEALGELKQALNLNPRHYWSSFLLGICQEERGEHALAYGAFSVCVHLWPEFAWGYYNRARALRRLGRQGEALEDYTASLKHDPNLAEAYINRGLLYLDLLKPVQALADFDAAAALGRDQVLVHGGRGIALEALGRPAEADAAFNRAGERDPDNIDMLLGQGFAVSQRSPEKAMRAFSKVLIREPRNPRALYGYAMLLQRQSRNSAEALTCFNLALQADPTFVAARLGRANVLAYRGEYDQARQDIDWCVKAEPTGVTLYAAACVYALMADKIPEPTSTALADRAMHLLREAFERGYGKDKAAGDADLARLKRRPDFRLLLQQAAPASVDQRGG